MHARIVMGFARSGAVVAMLVLFLPGAALAAEAPPAPVGSRGNALEVGAAAGFAQGWSAGLARGRSPLLTSGVGGAFGIDLGYRATPNLVLGVWGLVSQLGQSAAQVQPANIYGASAGIGGMWHFRPAAPDADPWLAVGTGWRGEWSVYQGAVAAQHGLEVARARLGVDVRVSPDVAIGPEVGGSLDMFLVQEIPGRTWQGVGSNAFAESLFAGVHGTFDVPLYRVP